MSNDFEYLSFSDAQRFAVDCLAKSAHALTDHESIIGVFDLTGRLSLLWLNRTKDPAPILSRLKPLGGYLNTEIWDIQSEDEADGAFFEELWKDGTAVHGAQRIRLISRHAQLSGWFKNAGAPHNQPAHAAVAFSAAKGGLGRSTALIGFALHLAAAGKRVIAIDCDFAAPGVSGHLLPSPSSRMHLGVLDYLLDHQVLGKIDLSRYIVRSSIADSSLRGDVRVMPVSGLNSDLLEKLSRVDVSLRFDASRMRQQLAGLVRDLHHIAKADVVLVDTPPGINDITGAIVSDIAPTVVHFADNSPHGLVSTRFAARSVGRARLTQGLPQLPFIVCQGMAPARAATSSHRQFAGSFLDIMEAEYLTSTDDPSSWSIHDIDSQDGPHVPTKLLYSERIALADSPTALASALQADPDLVSLYAHIEEQVL